MQDRAGLSGERRTPCEQQGGPGLPEETVEGGTQRAGNSRGAAFERLFASASSLE